MATVFRKEILKLLFNGYLDGERGVTFMQDSMAARRTIQEIVVITSKPSSAGQASGYAGAK